MFYEEVLETLEGGGRAVLVTLLTTGKSSAVIVGGKRFWTPGRVSGSLGVEWLNREADSLADRALKNGRLETKRMPAPERPGEELTLIAEPFFPPDVLVIFGGGHISLSLAQFANLLGYRIIVVDDRPAFANRERFPAAMQVVCDDFNRAIAQLSLGPWSSVVIATRGHRHDLTCLERVVEKDLAYLGMIGSRRRVRMVKEHLKAQGVQEPHLARVHMPIGLDIGAQTPEEIAVSIAAELIKIRRGGTSQSLSGVKEPEAGVGYAGISNHDVELIKAVVDYRRQGIPAALATVVATRGSTPRKAGAKILVLPDGSIMGTIGGGCIEGEVRREALNILSNRQPGLFKFYMDNEVAADEGMACGGAMEVFIELIQDKE